MLIMRSDLVLAAFLGIYL
jgi:hypothetical protein